jgi:hypothetical protein
MTRQEIIAMAEKCQLITPENIVGIYADALEAFAKLVIESDRDMCADVVELFAIHGYDLTGDMELSEFIRSGAK